MKLPTGSGGLTFDFLPSINYIDLAGPSRGSFIHICCRGVCPELREGARAILADIFKNRFVAHEVISPLAPSRICRAYFSKSLAGSTECSHGFRTIEFADRHSTAAPAQRKISPSNCEPDHNA
jgi:hypothetical protein